MNSLNLAYTTICGVPLCEREREEIKKEQHQRPGDPATQTGTVVGTTTVQWNVVPKSIGPNFWPVWMEGGRRGSRGE